MKERYYSLDVFRGATVALMILVNNPGNWSHIYAPLDHSDWHGCTPTDLVFPFFLFAVGNAMAFVIPKMQMQGDTTAFWKKVLKRFVLIFLIGLFLNWCPFCYWLKGSLHFKGWENTTLDDGGNPITTGIRILGVLQRISICYLFASIIAFFTNPKTTLWIGVGILLFYWLITYLLGKTGDPYSMLGFWGTNVDIKVLGANHMYHGEGVAFDPEGLASAIAAIVQPLFGYLTGLYIQKKGKTYEMLANLFVFGAILIFIGFAWDMVFPINKKIWTSSFVVYTTGLALMVIGVFIYLLEFKNKKISLTSDSQSLLSDPKHYEDQKSAWSRFFDVFGKNPLFIFFLSGFLPRVQALIRIPANINADGNLNYISPFSWFYEHVCKNIVASDLRVGSLFFAICSIAMYWSFAWIMDKKKIYVKV